MRTIAPSDSDSLILFSEAKHFSANTLAFCIALLDGYDIFHLYISVGKLVRHCSGILIRLEPLKYLITSGILASSHKSPQSSCL